MDITVAYTIWTVVAVAIFVGIVIWAWSSKRKSGFDAAARMPLDDDKYDRPEHRSDRENGVRPQSSGHGKIGV